jgi:hypothetical protein
MQDIVFDLPNIHKQGSNENDTLLSKADDFREAVIELSSQALRNIYILTPHLEPEIYDNQEFLDNVLALCRGNRQSSVKILLQDSSWVIKHGHGLVRLAQRLTSSIAIRNPVEEYRIINSSFMIADGTGLVFRQEADTYRGFFNPDCRYRAGNLDNIFMDIWEHAHEDIQLRKLYI